MCLHQCTFPRNEYSWMGTFLYVRRKLPLVACSRSSLVMLSRRFVYWEAHVFFFFFSANERTHSASPQTQKRSRA